MYLLFWLLHYVIIRIWYLFVVSCVSDAFLELFFFFVIFFFKQKTAYDMRISDWSSDVCSSDLCHRSCRRSRPEAGACRRARRSRDRPDPPPDHTARQATERRDRLCGPPRPGHLVERGWRRQCAWYDARQDPLAVGIWSDRPGLSADRKSTRLNSSH